MRFVSWRTWMFVLGSGIAAAAIISAFAFLPALANGSETQTNFIGATSGSMVYAQNNGNGGGVEGVTGAVAGGQAIYGLANNAANTGFGVHGKTFGINSTALFGEAVNTNTGSPSIGIFGFSNSGNGIYAFTATDLSNALFATNTGTGGGGNYAIEGFIGSGAGINLKGVLGDSAHFHGVVGRTEDATLGGSAGVLGIDNQNTLVTNWGGNFTTNRGTGVRGFSTGTGTFPGPASEGVLGITNACSSCPFGYGVWGNDTGTGNFGVRAETNSGVALFGIVNTTGIAVRLRGTGINATCTSSALHDILSVDNIGNVRACGTITGSTTPLFVTQTVTGKSVASYGARQSMPTIEDLGSAQLVSGQSYVRLDPTFASTIDRHASYLVFITPEGDSRGLYVTQKTLSGFAVRESQGGHSTLAFSYRIVAKPADTNAARLATIQRTPLAQLSGKAALWSPSLSPLVLHSRPEAPAAAPQALPLTIRQAINRDLQMTRSH